MGDGCIDWSEFRRQIHLFVRADASWCIRKQHDGSGGEFIEKRVIRTILKEVASDTDCESWPKDQVSDDEENDRMAVTNWTDSVSVIEYHVVWHFGYSVPVLYFRAFRSDGRQLTTDQIWQMIDQDRCNPNQSFFEVITQFEHPLLGKPFFAVHPCHTHTLMKATHRVFVEQSLTKYRFNYLLSWLSCVGPLIGLKIDSELVDIVEKLGQKINDD